MIVIALCGGVALLQAHIREQVKLNTGEALSYTHYVYGRVYLLGRAVYLVLVVVLALGGLHRERVHGTLELSPRTSRRARFLTVGSTASAEHRPGGRGRPRRSRSGDHRGARRPACLPPTPLRPRPWRTPQTKLIETARVPSVN
jgi:hypothetical protein